MRTQRYDSLNRLSQTVFTTGNTVNFAYDINSHINHIVAPNSAATQYVHDDLGNRLEETSPDRGTLTYTYGNAGNVKTINDARGITVAYTYDALNRVTTVDYPGIAYGIPVGGELEYTDRSTLVRAQRPARGVSV